VRDLSDYEKIGVVQYLKNRGVFDENTVSIYLPQTKWSMGHTQKMIVFLLLKIF